MSSFAAWYREGGPVMHVVLVIGLVGLAVAADRLVAVSRGSRSIGRPFIDKVVQMVRAEKIDEAIKLCASSHSYLPDIGLIILRSRSRDNADLESVATTASLAVAPRLRRRMALMSALAKMAIIAGVLGLVLQLSDGSAATQLSNVDNKALMSALSLGLHPLAFGLCVALVLRAIDAYVATRAATIVDAAEELSARLVNALIDRPDVRLGHR